MLSTTQNWLKFTGLTYSELLKQVTDSLQADPKFDNFRESAIAETMTEIFTAVGDFVNYYIERQAEESFFETSQRPSSAILNSRNLAYDITRPIPASTTLRITISGNMNGKISAGKKLQFPVFTKFTYQNNDFILTKGFTYTFTIEDAQQVVDQGDAFVKTIDVDDNGDEISLVQGTLTSITIPGATNPQVGQIFQTYRIPDATFSNFYGNADLPNFPTTKVWVGGDPDDPEDNPNAYIIDRRSLINQATIQGVITNTPVKCVLVRTAVDGGVELKFGSAKIASLGATVDTDSPNTTFDNIFVQYLSTTGTKANQVGVIGNKLTYSNQIILNPYNITDNVVFTFLSNIIGGGDLESAESIKLNAPGIFYSLDRAVNGQDHLNILKSLTSPIKVKNAIAWGEQEEARARNVAAIVELFNVGFFTCVGSLYNLEGDPATATYSVRTNTNRIDEAVLDDNFDQDAMASQYYFNIYVKNMVARQLKEQVIASFFWELNSFFSVAGNHSSTYFAQQYPNDVTIDILYNSDKYFVVSQGTGSITVNLSSVSLSGMPGIATILQTQLRLVTDLRSEIVGMQNLNLNYGFSAFPNIEVTWDADSSKFIIKNSQADNCYLSSIGVTAQTAAPIQLVQDLGLYDQTSTPTSNPAIFIPVVPAKINVNINYNFVSDKITQVINTLFGKGQITLQYIYASPIIQSFKLEGTVYIQQLFSVDDLHRQIDNASYMFLDENADFNKSIYISNIVDVIENFPGVDHADVKFSPDIPYPPADPLNPARTTFFYPGSSYQPVQNWGAQANTIYNAIFTMLQQYVDPSVFDEPTWRAVINSSRTLTPNQVFNNDMFKVIKERYFLSIMISSLYASLVAALGPSTDQLTQFQDTPDFTTLVSDIHKDLSWIIRSNMIDSNGNISPEYKITTNSFGVNTKTLLRGGYSLGDEIGKLNLEATTPGANSVPYLTYVYK